MLYSVCDGLGLLPRVEQEAAKLTGAKTECCVERIVRMNTHFKFLILSVVIQAPSISLPLLISNALSVSLKTGSELQVREQNT